MTFFLHTEGCGECPYMYVPGSHKKSRGLAILVNPLCLLFDLIVIRRICCIIARLMSTPTSHHNFGNRSLLIITWNKFVILRKLSITAINNSYNLLPGWEDKPRLIAQADDRYEETEACPDPSCIRQGSSHLQAADEVLRSPVEPTPSCRSRR